MTNCKACQASKAELHFGGISCRACAAFFRRYVHSPKRNIYCNCDVRQKGSLPCRKCRMDRCLAAGMSKDKVQPPREKNKLETNENDIPSPSLTNLYQIVSRDSSKIHETLSKWENIEFQRKVLYGGDINRLNFYEISCLTGLDAKIIWPVVEDLFPVMRTINKSDKEALLSNLMSKYFVIEAAIQTEFNLSWFQEPSKYLEDNEENHSLLINFYGGAMPEKYKMSREEVLRIFWPFWMYYYKRIVLPIYEKRNDTVESIAHLLLILFDHAFTNISNECAEHCRSLRNLILRELRGYQMDKNQPESRLFDVLENLMLIERADEKFQEEIQICELYNVRLHQDFRRFFVNVDRI